MSRNHNATPDPPARERAALGRLLQHIDEQCSRECGAITSEASDAAWRIVAEARDRAARMLREARRRERAIVNEQVRAEAARQRARLRKAGMDQHRILTDDAMTRLRELLFELWHDDPEVRRRWLQSALQQAARTLPATRWRIEIPPPGRSTPRVRRRPIRSRAHPNRRNGRGSTISTPAFESVPETHC